jgi:transposase InsO family protein
LSEKLDSVFFFGIKHLSGKQLTHQQVKRYMNNRQAGATQAVAAARAGISERTGRRIEKNERQTPKQRHWRTRKDPLAQIWESTLVPLLESEPGLTAITLWEYLDDNYPGAYPETLLRTLQRRVKTWRATQGPQKPVIFRQSVPPGHQGLSDFTHPDTPITINGEPFKHLLYHFRLAYSGWRDVLVIRGGESYSALADGLQTALFKLGGVPEEHRTDSLSAAYSNSVQKIQLTKSYESLCAHYGLRGTTNNTGVSHENGAIEAPHGTLKRRIKQQIKLRGSNDFKSVQEYQDFINKITERLNKRCKARLAEEKSVLRQLPTDRAIAYTRLSVKVTTSSTITVKRVLYTVPSRLIGEILNVHLYHDRLDCFYAQRQVITLQRVYPNEPSGRARLINYKHVIHSLAAKPQAFRFSQFRDDLLPSPQYKQLWALAEEQFDPRMACKWIVSVLRIAYENDCESLLAVELLLEADRTRLPELKTLQERYLNIVAPPKIPVRQHKATDYDELLQSNWAAEVADHG